MFGFTAGARTFDFKQLKSTGSKGSAEYWWQGTEKSKSSWLQIKVGSASKIDDTSPMEIRAATVLKSVKDRKSGINDVAKFEFDPINRGPAIFFMVATGAAFSREHDSYYYGNVNTGWQLAGCIIEIWQKGKVVKHWSNVTGKDGKTKLTDNIKELRINRDGRPCAGDRFYESRSFDNATEIYSVDKDGERVDINDVLKPFREAGSGASKDDGVPAAKTLVKNAVAPKLQSCDFLLNGRFKKNAKVYLCLFSASWCPPCRAEMPRIAKTYAETLKDDPDIELIHFSRDQNDEKALAWAKEHDVKFPVVKPNGGNPLNLHTRGIPHLFIVKADGTLLEEGHPMRIFNEEKFREIKSGNVKPRAAERTEQSQLTCETTTNGVKWSYKIVDGGVVFKGGYCSGAKLAVPQETSGALVIPDKLGGYPVRCIDEAAFRYCRRLTSVTIPSTVTSIRGNPFSGCSGIESFVVAPDNPMYSSVNGLLCTKDGKTVIAGVKGDLKIPEGVTTIGKSAFYACWGLKSVSIPTSVKKIEPLAFYNSGLTSVTIPEGVVSIGNSAFGDCWGMTSVTLPSSVVDIGSQAFSAMSGKMKSIQVSPDNQKFASVNSLLCSKDGKTVICGVDGDVVIPDGVRSIGDSAFYKCQGLLTVTIPPSVTKIGNAAFEWCDKIRSFAVASANPEYESSNGLLCSKDGGILIAGVNGSVEIPEGVTEIVDSAFSGRNELTAVTIPLSVTKIGKEAFRCCRGLTMVKMLGERPNSDREVFCYCKMLKAIHVPPNAKSWAGMKEWQGIPLVFDAETK